MPQNHTNALAYAKTWIDIIKHKKRPDRELSEWIITESLENFAEHFNKGWLENRKSVTEGGMWAATEWQGKGAMFEDVMGRKYLDWLGGYGLFSHGWSHPDVVEAVQAQLLHNPMPSQELIDPLRGVLAKLLAEITPGDLKYSFFCASGTEANEGAIKLAKMYTKKSAFISTVNAFHGKTMGSLSMMGKALYREPVGQMYGGPVYFVEFGNAEAMKVQLETCKKLGIGVAGVIIEPIQGEAGAVVPPDDYWPKVRELTKEHGALLIADEVQTGLGRTGKMFGVDHWGVTPDIMTLGKSLGGGVMPISAFISTEEIWQCMMYPNPFIHTTTTGGGALACSAAIAGIEVMLRDDLPGQAKEKGDYMMKRLQGFVKKYPKIYESITGKGLLIGQHFTSKEIGYQVASELFEGGVLVGGTLNSAKTIRIEPPLVITYEEIDQGLDILEKTLEHIQKQIDTKGKPIFFETIKQSRSKN
ncbi:aminotransferase class III-fold pyridoxal phosphate-dependent enzyme [Candidatus Gracilibacteria bacterium]|nr:aminotransferase class III-fold pyridoxal phosphate-dependent enzyme [Candidatus Gracilibacteria bacterium]